MAKSEGWQKDAVTRDWGEKLCIQTKEGKEEGRRQSLSALAAAANREATWKVLGTEAVRQCA
eukprot:gene39009-63340_t